MTDLKHGTKVRTKGFPACGGFPPVEPEDMTIVKWNVARNGERMPGWHIVRFVKGGGRLCMHEERFTVVPVCSE
jgi:hypothetical protein